MYDININIFYEKTFQNHATYQFTFTNLLNFLNYKIKNIQKILLH